MITNYVSKIDGVRIFRFTPLSDTRGTFIKFHSLSESSLLTNSLGDFNLHWPTKEFSSTQMNFIGFLFVVAAEVHRDSLRN